MTLTESVKSFHVPATPGTSAWPPSLPSVPTSRDTGDFSGERPKLIDHRINGVFQFENFAFNVYRDLAGEVSASHGRRDLGDVSDLVREVGAHRIHRVRQILPGAGDSWNDGLHAKTPLRTHFARDAGHFGSK